MVFFKIRNVDFGFKDIVFNQSKLLVFKLVFFFIWGIERNQGLVGNISSIGKVALNSYLEIKLGDLGSCFGKIS